MPPDSPIPVNTIVPTIDRKTPPIQGEVEPTLRAPIPTLINPNDLPPVNPIVGGLAPEITLTTLDQQSIQLSQLRGNYILINYWVTWCIPCMEELPALNRVSQDYQDDNVVILTINGITKDQINDVKQTASDLNLTLPILLDEDDSFWTNYQVHFLPTSFLIDHNGVIREIIRGSATEEAIREKLDLLVSGQL